MDNNCHIPDLEYALSCVHNGALNLVLKLAKSLTCMTSASYSMILTTMSYIIGRQIRVQPSTMCYNLGYYKNKQLYKNNKILTILTGHTAVHGRKKMYNKEAQVVI